MTGIQSLTLGEAAEGYLEYVQLISPSKTTLRNAKWILKRLVDFFGDENLANLTPSHFLKFQIQSADRLSHDSLRTAIGYLKAFATWMDSEGLTKANLGGLMRKPKRQKRAIETIGKQKIAAILANAREDEPPAISVGVHLLALAGLRLNETCRLRNDDVDLDARTINVRGGKGDYSSRTIPMHSKLDSELRRYLSSQELQPGDALLLDRGKPLPDYTLRRAVERVGKEMDIKLTPQILRRSIASLLHAQGGRIEAVGAFLGHAPSTNALTLNHYVSISMAEMRTMVDGLRIA